MGKLYFIAFLCFTIAAQAQETYPVNGVHDHRPEIYVFKNASIFVSPEVFQDSAMLVIKEGEVWATGRNLQIPSGAIEIDLKGKFIYPSFIDAYAGYNVSPKKKEDIKDASGKRNGSHWNQAIHPEYQYRPEFPVSKKIKEDWLASGIGIVNVHEQDGIMRGASKIFHIGLDESTQALLEPSTAHFSFNKGTSQSDYPSSHMGAIALLRQTFYDAQWYQSQSIPRQEENEAYKALASVRESSNIFELNHPLSVRNVQEMASEFEIDFVMKGTGKEYMAIQEMTETATFIVPLNFPKAYDVSDPYVARRVSLRDLKHWELAPFNAILLEEEGHQIALSRDTLKTSKSFLEALRKVNETGFDHEKLLRALTVTPAQILKIEDYSGTLEPGKLANFFISTTRITEEDFHITSHWNKGKKVYEKEAPNTSLIGKYNLVIEQQDYPFEILSADQKAFKAKASDPSGKELEVTFVEEKSLVNIVLKQEGELLYQLSGKISLGGAIWDGKGQSIDGEWITWAAVKDRNQNKTEEEKQEQPTSSRPMLWHPNTAYGWDSLNSENSFIITNAIVWTCADTGKLDLADVWVENGKIKAVGKGMLYPTSLKRIDAKGRHVTPGIIDEHSHIGIRGGVNEGTQSSSAEVRIGDSVDPWNVNFYRQLAGGVTAAQLLHGSANPIGGQSALVKFKWGMSSHDMLIDDAPKFIKFALGENVKRSNTKDNKGRFPLTRMGVEESIEDAFVRATEYRDKSAMPQATSRKRSAQSPPKELVRNDLELDALVEILNDERYISCHSYVQSEILMLMQLADSLGFRVNTFTHILEGYKVAEQLKEHEAFGSTFSDWWAYKFEVNDAIPYNAALMTKAGVVTAINSDDAEMGRRLNQEAAKAIKYGGLTEESALKMITINPAKALHLDDRIGSIEPGKEADLVIWSDHPLSVYAHAEKTFIEGRMFYNANNLDAQNKRIQSERARLVGAMIADKGKKQEAPVTEEKHYHCDTMLEDYIQE